MNVLITIDENYVMPALVMLESLFYNTQGKIKIYIIHSDVTQASIEKIECIAGKFNQDVNIIAVPAAYFEYAYTSIHITKAAYYRLLAYKLLPQDLDRVLYLDPDLIVQKDLTPFYNTAFKTDTGLLCYFVVCEGPGVSGNEWKVYDDLGIPHDKLYFNLGVMLMNLAELRRDVKQEVIMEFVSENDRVLKYHDQDTLNALFYNNLRFVDWHIYNQTILHIKSKKEAGERLKKAVIIHYAGSDKPWNYNYKSYFFYLFWKYALRTGYRKEFVSVSIKRAFWLIRNKLHLASRVS